MNKGKPPRLFHVGTIDVEGREETMVMSTTQVHRLISGMNGASDIVVLAIRKKGKERQIKLSNTNELNK